MVVPQAFSVIHISLSLMTCTATIFLLISRINVCMLNCSPLNGSAVRVLICACVGPMGSLPVSFLIAPGWGRLAANVHRAVIYCPYAALQPLCACTACPDLLLALRVTSLQIHSTFGFSVLSLTMHSVSGFTGKALACLCFCVEHLKSFQGE